LAGVVKVGRVDRRLSRVRRYEDGLSAFEK